MPGLIGDYVSVLLKWIERKNMNLHGPKFANTRCPRSSWIPGIRYIYDFPMIRLIILSILLSGLLAPTATYAQFYQGSNVEFGKNRVQYKEFEWFYYPGENFEVYYYIGGEQLAQYVLISCEKNLPQIQKFFDFPLEEKIQVLSYVKQSEFRQSNIGILGDDQFNIGGAARILGNKLFTYYEGDHARLEIQIRENLSRVVFSQMMYGGDWKDVLKSSTLLSIPKWYEEGIIRFAARGKTLQADQFMRDRVQQGRLKSLNRLYNEEAALGGEAFWAYVAEVYGASVIPNILYMARVSRNVESGFLFVLGQSIDTVTRDFIRYYESRQGKGRIQLLPGEPPLPADGSRSAKKAWKKENKKLGQLPVRYKKKYRYTHLNISPDARYMAYVTNEMGQYKVWIFDRETGKRKRILKREYRLDRIQDESFPVMAWHPSGTFLTIVTERKGRAYIGQYNLDEKKWTEKELFRLEKVTSMDYSPDGKRIIMSGVNRGQTDLYLYQVIGNNYEQLTNDIFDDLQPRFLRDGKSVIFASNRPDDTLRKNVPIDRYQTTKDIFIFPIERRSNVLERVTNTPDRDEQYPSGYSRGHYTYLAQSGTTLNRYMSRIDSTISRIDTAVHYRYFTASHLISDLPRSPEYYQFEEATGNYILAFKRGSKPVISFGSRGDDRLLGLAEEAGETSSPPEEPPVGGTMQRVQDDLPPDQINIRNYTFEDERKNYQYDKQTVRITEVGKAPETADAAPLGTIEIPKARVYRLNFATDYVLTQVDNSFTSAFYQNFSGPTSINPGISGLIKVGASDLFEDFKIVGGFRLSGDLQNNDYGITFENLKRRWDRRYTFQRQSQFQSFQFNFFKTNTHSFTYQLRYPFNELTSVRITGIMRHDRIVLLSVDPQSLAQPNFNEYNAGVRVEYVFDNTINRGLNLYNGTRYKFWLERYQQPDKWDRRTDFNVAGFDFRHYQRIHRELIAAFRFAGATTFGHYKLIHYLGGVDNWLFQRIDSSTPIAFDQNYSFQSFAGPMRGFYVNARNGSSVAMSSAEIRWPVFKHLLNKPIRSDFVENFQIVGFLDAGTAWTGRDPYSDENAFNQTVVEQNPVTVTIDNNREPIIYGYGFGLRSRVLGYFVRADWAWGVDDGQVLPRVFYLSLNLDF